MLGEEESVQESKQNSSDRLIAELKYISAMYVSVECFAEYLDDVPITMVRIPGGTFEMGSNYGDEGPRHSVTVPPFFISRFEITREQWRVVAQMPKVRIDLTEDPSNFKDSLKQPVEQVSWEEAIEFCERLRKKTGNQTYRLPSEAEWEYAGGAGPPEFISDTRVITRGTFAFGYQITPQIVNYNGERPYFLAAKGLYRGRTVEVGLLGVTNAFGLFDMHGNVWEWCADVWHDTYGGQNGNPPSDGSAWITGGDQYKRIIRGGSWSSDGERCRTTNRGNAVVGGRFNDVGFRIVCTAISSN
jgi:formylglycine-generating enzyme required for sulfatase activity